MLSLIDQIKEDVLASFRRLYGPVIEDVEVAPADPQFGDYQCNSALKSAKILKKKPSLIAEEVANDLKQHSSAIKDAAPAGPGFINISIADTLLEEYGDRLLKKMENIVPQDAQKRTMVEFSSPNIAKEMHVGHLRSTIIGDSLARLFEERGHTVLRINHVGDWGTQFGMLIAFLKKFHPDFWEDPENASLADLMAWYKQAKVVFDSDLSFKKEAQKEVVSLQGGNSESLEIWRLICAVSRKGFEEIYTLLGTHLEERGESFYNPFLKDVVEELESKGLITISEGAKCVFLEEFKNREGGPLPLIVQKSDKGFNYATTDLASLKHRIFKDQCQRIVYVTDAGQSLHFAQVFKTAEKAGWIPDTLRINHVAFGLVLGEDGKKYKTRSGDTPKLKDLLMEAIARAHELIKERNPEQNEQERAQLAKKLGISAVKYADLASHRLSDYQFSFERMLRFDGNTAAFILYSLVRCKSILEKAHFKKEQPHSIDPLSENAERALMLHIYRFREVLNTFAEDLTPHILADYLYGLANTFNQFFRDCRVIGDKEEQKRLALVYLTVLTLEKGLYILGIETVEKM